MDKNKGFACSFLPIGDKGESPTSHCEARSKLVTPKPSTNLYF
jgi:hypothetical protein